MEVRYLDPSEGTTRTTECGSFKETDHGVMLYEYNLRDGAFGYVPYDNLIAIVPEADDREEDTE